ncbi:MAG: hypothetical protein KBT28_04225 [Bacteroidales bacterium]|nr:hypothetical protein [Candidatus Colimorpha merdihippi]
MPRFVKAVPITDENREIIGNLTNGQRISKEDATRLAADLVGKRNRSRVRFGIADYLFDVSREDTRLGKEIRRNGNSSRPGSYSTTGNGSNKDNIQRLTYSNGTLYGFGFNIITKLIL